MPSALVNERRKHGGVRLCETRVALSFHKLVGFSAYNINRIENGKETQVNIRLSSLPIFVRLSRSCGVSVEIVQQTGHLIQCLLVAIDVGHCHHILPLTV